MEIIAPQEVSPTEMGAGVARIEVQGAGEVGLGAGSISRKAGVPARYQRQWIVRVGGLDRLGEGLLSFVTAAETGKCVGPRRPDARGPPTEGDRAVQVACRLIPVAKLQAGQGAVDQGLDEVGVELEGAVVGHPSLAQAAGAGQGEAAVQVWPGEVGGEGRTHTKVERGIGMSSLIEMADPEGEPSPESACIERDGAAQGKLGEVGPTASQ